MTINEQFEAALETIGVYGSSLYTDNTRAHVEELKATIRAHVSAEYLRGIRDCFELAREGQMMLDEFERYWVFEHDDAESVIAALEEKAK
jgi:hypothetical protein